MVIKIYQNKKIENEYHVMYQLERANKGLTRDELCERTGLKRTTIFDTLLRLKIDFDIQTAKLKEKPRGRPKTLWMIKEFAKKRPDE